MYASTAVNNDSTGIPQAYVNQTLKIFSLEIFRLQNWLVEFTRIFYHISDEWYDLTVMAKGMDETERERGFQEGSKFKLTVPFMVKCLFKGTVSLLNDGF